MVIFFDSLISLSISLCNNRSKSAMFNYLTYSVLQGCRFLHLPEYLPLISLRASYVSPFMILCFLVIISLITYFDKKQIFIKI